MMHHLSLITFAILSIIFAFSFATRCLASSISCCFFGRNAKCFNPKDSGLEVLKGKKVGKILIIVGSWKALTRPSELYYGHALNGVDAPLDFF